MPSIRDIVKREEAKHPNIQSFVSHKGFYEKLLLRNSNQGGQSLIAIGPMGCGKTSLLGNVVQDLLHDNHNGEVLFWRGTFAAEFSKFPSYKIHVDSKLYPLKIFEDGKQIQVDQTPFNSFSDLLTNADMTKLNVVYMDDEIIKWAEFVMWLYKYANRWVSIFLDEAEDVIPNYAKGDEWDAVQRFGYAFKHSRKRKTSIYLTSQNMPDIFWLVAQKSQTYAFLMGSRRYGPSCLKQVAINNLNIGECYLTRGALFEKRAFPPILPSKKDTVIRNLPDVGMAIVKPKKPTPRKANSTSFKKGFTGKKVGKSLKS